MKIYLLSLAAGLAVGVLYGLIQVRSPAPPMIALAGLLGILLGEQAVPIAKRAWTTGELSLSALAEECSQHLLAQLPSRSSTSPPADAPSSGPARLT